MNIRSTASSESSPELLSIPTRHVPQSPPKKRRRWWIWALLTGLVPGATAVLMTLFGVFGESPRFQTASVTRRRLRETVSASGTINSTISVTVGAEVTGVIRRVYVDFDSSVKAGQVIAEIDTALYRAMLIQQQGELAQAQASLKLAEANLRRNQNLFDRKILAAADFDAALASAEQARAVLLTRQGAYEKSKTDLDHCTIRSPIDGVVTSRVIDVGQTVTAGFNTPSLFTVVNDLRKMQIDASMAEADVGGVMAGQSVDFTVDAYPNRIFHGRVKQVHSAPNSSTNTGSLTGSSSSSTVVTYDTVIEVDNADLKLKPGMTASVSVVLAERDDALAIPNSALRFSPPASTTGAPGSNLPLANQNSDWRRVYSLAKESSGGRERPALRPVRIGITDGTFSEVLSGLNQHDQVIVALTAKSKVAKFSFPPPPEDFRP